MLHSLHFGFLLCPHLSLSQQFRTGNPCLHISLTLALVLPTMQSQSEKRDTSDDVCNVTSAGVFVTATVDVGAGARGWAEPVLSLFKVGPRLRSWLSHHPAVTQATWRYEEISTSDIIVCEQWECMWQIISDDNLRSQQQIRVGVFLLWDKESNVKTNYLGFI